MNKNLLYSFIFCCFLLQTYGQDRSVKQNISLDTPYNGRYYSTWIQFQSENKVLHSFGIKLTESIDWDDLEYRGGQKDQWRNLSKNDHQNEDLDEIISNLIFIYKDSLQLRSKDALNAQLYLFHSEIRANSKSRGVNQFCECDSIQLRTRDHWCPDGDCPLDPTPVPHEVKFLIIHHTASGNDAPDYDAVVRSYYRFHVETRGWDDIGYNYLISPEGIIYEGRGHEILGAHFCAQNTGTLGIGLIGDYSSLVPNDTILQSAQRLSSFMSCLKNIVIDEISYHESSQSLLNHLSGHRDGCNTACPGDQVYTRLPALLDSILVYQADSCFLEPIILELNEISGLFSLDWNATNRFPVQYRILFAENEDGTFAPIDSVNGTELSYDLGTDPSPGWYQIQSVLENGSEQCSNSVNINFSATWEWNEQEAQLQNLQLFNNMGQMLGTGNQSQIRQILRESPQGIYWILANKAIFKYIN